MRSIGANYWTALFSASNVSPSLQQMLDRNVHIRVVQMYSTLYPKKLCTKCYVPNVEIERRNSSPNGVQTNLGRAHLGG